MQKTTNYGLLKPDPEDFYNIEDFNNNMDVIDEELKKAAQTGGGSSQELTEHLANTNNPHGVTASQVGLGNVPNVTTNNQTPTYAVPDTVQELASGEKLSVAMGKTAKAVKEFISAKEDIAENTAGVGSINTALASAGVNSWLLADNSIPSKLSFANLIVKGVVTFFTVTEDSNFPANYGSGVFIPMADKNIKFVYYMAGNSFYVGRVASGAVTWYEQASKNQINNVCTNSFAWAKTLTLTFETRPNSENSLQIMTQEGLLAFDYANGNFRSRGGSTLSKVVNCSLQDDVLTITESAYEFTQTLSGNVLTISFGGNWACGVIISSKPFTLATSQ